MPRTWSPIGRRERSTNDSGRKADLLFSIGGPATRGILAAVALQACSEVPAAQRSSPSTGDGYASLYSDSTLAYWKGRYEPNIRHNLDNLILPSLADSERRAAKELSLEFPPRDSRDPLAYHVASPPPTITVSTLSIKFLDDVAIASAWLDANGYSLESLAYYTDVLKYRKPTAFAGSRYPPPLTALGVPTDALREKRVDHVSQLILKSAVVFILAHEVGHVVHGHSAATGIEERQRYEMTADRFAINTFRRIGVAPIGMVTFFLISSRLQPHRGDFQTHEAWASWLRSEATHPLTSRRLKALASALRANPEDFARSEQMPARTAQAIDLAANDIDRIASLLDDPLVHRHAAIVGTRIPLSELLPRRQGESWVPR